MDIFSKDKIRFLLPKNKVLEHNGNISYNEGYQAWHLLRFKADLLKEFPQLKEKSKPVSYQLIYFREHKDLMDFMKDLKDKEVLPVLLFFYREVKNNLSL